jgi:hypothetical protein
MVALISIILTGWKTAYFEVFTELTLTFIFRFVNIGFDILIILLNNNAIFPLTQNRTIDCIPISIGGGVREE